MGLRGRPVLAPERCLSLLETQFTALPWVPLLRPRDMSLGWERKVGWRLSRYKGEDSAALVSLTRSFDKFLPPCAPEQDPRGCAVRRFLPGGGLSVGTVTGLPLGPGTSLLQRQTGLPPGCVSCVLSALSLRDAATRDEPLQRAGLPLRRGGLTTQGPTVRAGS